MRDTLDFLLYDWLEVDKLTQTTRFAEHSKETFDQVLDMSERMATGLFAPFNRLVDTQEPEFDGENVLLPKATHDAVRAYLDSGLIAATHDSSVGGMQLPLSIAMSAGLFFGKASNALSGYGMLTTGNAGLIMAHGTDKQKALFGQAELQGRWTGTMCLSEPHAGSSLSDITTRALPDGSEHESDPLGPRYRLFGRKMWISGGDHEITENIVHLVLAKIPNADGSLTPGTRGISLFIVPKRLVDLDGQLNGQRNDVALAGLNHKLGCRGITNTLLNFGEGKYPVQGAAGAIGYLVGKPGEGIKCMFHMMNEARIGVGLAAVALGLAGYEASLAYAKERPQGRPVGNLGKDAQAPQVPIIEHADVRRMLLAQKAYAEGGLALGLYCAKLLDDSRGADESTRETSRLLIELLLPIVKSWPSEWCLEANSLAIQVLGGCGYTRDFPVEQYWRDNRLNMIHEGTHGIQAMDLLGRKVVMSGGAALRALDGPLRATIERAKDNDELKAHADALRAGFETVIQSTQAAWSSIEPERALANATEYLRAFGHLVMAWMWLEVALAAQRSLARQPDNDLAKGKIMTAHYYFRHELPKIDHWLHLVAQRDSTCLDMQAHWF